MRSIPVLTILSLACAGCQFATVRNHAVELDAEIPALYNQLVLDNVAMAYTAPCNLPYFGTVSQNQVTNARTATLGVTPQWSEIITRTLAMPFTGSDQNQAAIQLLPVNSPDKLELLRELFVGAACACRCPGAEVPDDLSALKRYYDASSVAVVDYSKAVFWVDSQNPIDRRGKPPQPVCVDATSCVAAHMEPGRWPTHFQFVSCWFCVTTNEHEVPKHACYVGHYCDTYVWVPPEGAGQLRLLTMAALDIANVDLSQIKFAPPPKLRPNPSGNNVRPATRSEAVIPYPSAIGAAPTF